ncbi:MAG TPA: hypothetical protein VMW20_10080 [Candidatus Nanoarchaeia archaeon]|nr:hypothetical protein [Candidatus Nanoarchaeia archaeon]
MDRKIELPEITSMLHSCFFGLENAHSKLIGSGHRAIISEIAKMLPGIRKQRVNLNLMTILPLIRTCSCFRTI